MKTAMIRFYTKGNVYKGAVSNKQVHYSKEYSTIANWIRSSNILKYRDMTVTNILELKQLHAVITLVEGVRE